MLRPAASAGQPRAILPTCDGALKPEEGTKRALRLELGADDCGRRLDQVLVARVGSATGGGWSRTRLARLVEQGKVRVDGAVVAKPGLILLEHRVVEVDLAEEAGSKPSRYREPLVLFEDEHLVVLDKPAGTLTHGNVKGGEPSAASFAEERFGPLPRGEGDEGDAADRPGVVHRLDRETSGVLVLARTEEALVELKRQFKAREVEKTYAALVHGEPRFDSDWIENELGRSEKAPDRVSIVAAGTGRVATTYYETKERFKGFARLDVFPKTGRMHQVRVHLASIGHPIAGERVYLPRRRNLEKLPDSAPKLARQALHAAKLVVTHPATSERVALEAQWPADMQALLDWLRRERAEPA